MKYVRSKAVKRMEQYRVKKARKDDQRNVLLPVSCGVSSVTLLHIIDQQLQGQMDRTGRTAYSVHVLMIDTSAVEADTPTADDLDALRLRYPRHSYSMVTLTEVFKDGIKLLEDIPASRSDWNASNPLPTGQTMLHDFLSTLPSASSRADVLGIFRTRLVVAFAKERECESILWGDSTTRLAEKTLAETAKGRGFSLPWNMSEGASPHGINFIYPLRDVLKQELMTYSTLTSPPLTALIALKGSSTQVSASAKGTTIDDLMSQYFESVELNYPSVVANVVRTSSKLRTPQAQTSDQECGLCGFPIADGATGLHGWGGDQEHKTAALIVGDATVLESSGLCYGCARTMHGATASRNTTSTS